ncbi:MAG: FxsA family protein [Alphaproteobacteria bacterium]
MPFLIIFILIPLLEITAFIHIGGAIGVMPTLLIALGTAILGGTIIKYQGFMTMESVKLALAEGKTPVADIFNGFCLVASGALLITPGFVTDTIGFLLLVPPLRDMLRGFLGKYFKMQPPPSQSPYGQNPYRDDPGGIIEGDYERVDEDKKP